MLDRLPNVFISAPDRPAICLGAVSEFTAQPSAPSPLPKNDSAITATTIDCAST